ncbi:NAD(P)/FAD-dependent oxidoreductase [Methanospirillum lacunae]|uniref:NAD(P)/FAD-dependent oxidoreductase n=1 Tax=Methanospirillum lacunae TaxID=668570 RepID=A0A2V2NE06_9EURY|nr:NAD(P)/FAD-dependent oxidoreductase [Methanospirillum lacunae]PWR73831.1 NAD(P)/FAD-dependent oxidoreductase [Methanospirillum lacunae]
MDRNYEVVVVGAGPSGSAAAESCAKAGLNVLLIEEQAHIGVPVQCAGLLSCSAFEECKVSTRSVLNTVSGATVKAGHASLSFDAGKTKAYVVDRSMLDQEMGYAAADAGAEIQLKTQAHDLNINQHKILVRGSNGHEHIRYQILIAADGPRASIGRMAGLPRAPVYLSGLQCDLASEVDQDKVTIYPNASPEFFGWVIPMGEGRARVGMCGITHVREKFDTFISGFGSQRVQFVSGTIPLGTLKTTVAEGIMTVGDAAAMAKPTSGGGVYTGVRAARHAGAIVALACETGRTDPAFLSQYEKRWRSDIGKELKIGYAAFRYRQTISPQDMEQIVSVMSNPDIRDLIVQKGDMDRPGRLLRSLLLHPSMYRAGGVVIKSAIRALTE